LLFSFVQKWLIYCPSYPPPSRSFGLKHYIL